MNRTRIDIPTGPGELIALADTIENKHDELGKDSPLSLLDWSKVSPEIKEAVAAHKQIETLTRETEQLAQRRTNLVRELAQFVRQARDILAGVHRGEERKLSDYGFAVDDTPKAKKANTTKPPLAA